MNRLFILPLDFSTEAVHLTVYPAVLQDDQELILVDCGYPGFLPVIEREMKKHGISVCDLTKIIITHHDHDHMGALKEIHDAYPRIEILCSKEQEPYVTGKKKSLRLIQAEKLHETLPESEKPGSIQFMQMVASVKKVDQVTAIHPGDEFPWCGGIEVVDTKGHMPGHISLYVRGLKTLIAGDALVVENGKLCMAMPQFVLNRENAVQSAKNLLAYDLNRILCYHGGEFIGDITGNLKEITK